jgi:uncharacterized glyoxalase superfamily protein PhnB
MAKKAKKTKKKAAAKAAVKKSVKRSVKKPAARQVAARRKTAKPAKAAKAAAPKGHALMSVAPGFTANDAAATVKWYCDVLGFTVKERWEHDGQFHGAQIESGCVVINVGQDDWKMGRDRIKGQGMRMYIMTGPEIDALAAQIKARGGVLTQEPTDGWGMRSFSIDDPDGFKLTFMTELKG